MSVGGEGSPKFVVADSEDGEDGWPFTAMDRWQSEPLQSVVVQTEFGREIASSRVVYQSVFVGLLSRPTEGQV